jgi:hypothetical protein
MIGSRLSIFTFHPALGEPKMVTMQPLYSLFQAMESASIGCFEVSAGPPAASILDGVLMFVR